jgi:UDP-glucose 4-epimerase
MKVLVTGSSGFIGRQLCKALQDKGHSVIPVDLEHDLTRPEVAGALPVADAVFHLAANSSVMPTISNPALAVDNLLMTHNVLEYCRKNDVQTTIFTSSREAFTGVNPYAASKIAGEAWLKAYHNTYGLRYAAPRLSNIYGPGDSNPRFIPLMIEAALSGAEMVVYGDKKQLDFLYIDDVVGGLALCLENFDKVNDATFYIGSGQSTGLTTVAKTIKELTGSQSRITVTENRKGEVESFSSSIQFAQEKLGFQPEVTLVEGLKRTISWIKGGGRRG